MSSLLFNACCACAYNLCGACRGVMRQRVLCSPPCLSRYCSRYCSRTHLTPRHLRVPVTSGTREAHPLIPLAALISRPPQHVHVPAPSSPFTGPLVARALGATSYQVPALSGVCATHMRNAVNSFHQGLAAVLPGPLEHLEVPRSAADVVVIARARKQRSTPHSASRDRISSSPFDPPLDLRRVF